MSGWDTRYHGQPGNLRRDEQPAGLAIVEIDSGRVRRIDGGASGFTHADGRVLVAGETGAGLKIFSTSGRRILHVLREKRVFVIHAAAGHALVCVSGSCGQEARSVDLATGRVGSPLKLPDGFLLDPMIGASNDRPR